MDKRTILAIVLSMLVLFVYQTFFMKPPPKKPADPQQKEAVTAAPNAPRVRARPPRMCRRSRTWRRCRISIRRARSRPM